MQRLTVKTFVTNLGILYSLPSDVIFIHHIREPLVPFHPPAKQQTHSFQTHEHNFTPYSKFKIFMFIYVHKLQAPSNSYRVTVFLCRLLHKMTAMTTTHDTFLYTTQCCSNFNSVPVVNKDIKSCEVKRS